MEILKRRGMLKGIDIWIDEDYTEREREIQNWLKIIAVEEEKNGWETRVGYLKIKVGEEWYEWLEKEGRVEMISNFRD